MSDKTSDLAGPGIGDYAELERILPQDYRALLDPRDTQVALFAAKRYIEEQLCQELNLIPVTVPLIVDVEISPDRPETVRPPPGGRRRGTSHPA